MSDENTTDTLSLVADGIELVPVESLIPYSNNPKEHPQDQVRKIASSIKNYGWDQPIVVDGDGEIIKGHGRMQAAELLGLDEVPVIRREDLSDAEAKASRIADNKTAEAPWDDDRLSMELEVLAEQDPIDLDTLGFDDDELDELLHPPEMDVPDEFEDVDDDAIETEHTCPQCGYEW